MILQTALVNADLYLFPKMFDPLSIPLPFFSFEDPIFSIFTILNRTESFEPINKQWASRSTNHKPVSKSSMTRVYPDRICVLGTEEGIKLVQIDVRDKQGRPETLIYRSDENYQFSWDGRAPSKYEEVFMLPPDITRDFVWLFADLDIDICHASEDEGWTCKTEWNVPRGIYELSENGTKQ